MQGGPPKRILVVDDDSSIRGIVRGGLEDRGWICDEAENGVDAISKARALSPDLVVLDLAMPKMNGYEAAMVLKREMPRIALVMLTMYADVLGKSSADMLHVHAVISKTDGMTALIHCVQKILGT